MINLDNYRSGYAKKHYVYNEVENAKVTDFVNYYSQNGEDGVLEKIKVFRKGALSLELLQQALSN